MDGKYAKYLLEKTRQDYNIIAQHFSKTRNFVWEELKSLSQYSFTGERVLDLGCGNGRLLEIFKDISVDYIGVDSSEKLIEIAKRKYPKAKFQKGDALNLPFPANYFDKIYSIAVFHHIPSVKFRLRFLREAKRVLKPEGLLILTVWNLWQQKFLKYHLKFFFLKLIKKSKLDFKDIFYPWKNQAGEVVVQRYVHVFSKRELKKLVKKSGFKTKDIWLWGKAQRSNILLIAEK